MNKWEINKLEFVQVVHFTASLSVHQHRAVPLWFISSLFVFLLQPNANNSTRDLHLSFISSPLTITELKIKTSSLWSDQTWVQMYLTFWIGWSWWSRKIAFAIAHTKTDSEWWSKCEQTIIFNLIEKMINQHH